jgi:hypothetical protein
MQILKIMAWARLNATPGKNRLIFSKLQRSWLRHYATSWKVAGSIPDELTRFFD